MFKAHFTPQFLFWQSFVSVRSGGQPATLPPCRQMSGRTRSTSTNTVSIFRADGVSERLYRATCADYEAQFVQRPIKTYALFRLTRVNLIRFANADNALDYLYYTKREHDTVETKSATGIVNTSR